MREFSFQSDPIVPFYAADQPLANSLAMIVGKMDYIMQSGADFYERDSQAIFTPHEFVLIQRIRAQSRVNVTTEVYPDGYAKED